MPAVKDEAPIVEVYSEDDFKGHAIIDVAQSIFGGCGIDILEFYAHASRMEARHVIGGEAAVSTQYTQVTRAVKDGHTIADESLNFPERKTKGLPLYVELYKKHMKKIAEEDHDYEAGLHISDDERETIAKRYQQGVHADRSCARLSLMVPNFETRGYAMPMEHRRQQRISRSKGVEGRRSLGPNLLREEVLE